MKVNFATFPHDPGSTVSKVVCTGFSDSNLWFLPSQCLPQLWSKTTCQCLPCDCHRDTIWSVDSQLVVDVLKIAMQCIVGSRKKIGHTNNFNSIFKVCGIFCYLVALGVDWLKSRICFGTRQPWPCHLMHAALIRSQASHLCAFDSQHIWYLCRQVLSASTQYLSKHTKQIELESGVTRCSHCQMVSQ